VFSRSGGSSRIAGGNHDDDDDDDDDVRLARELSLQEEEANEILRRLPRRDDW
jgi:hypothetical protein